ncbi:MAG: CHASE domain-containing protein [Gammaproteobacteria bacterium]|nr:CHASE domain-containing protein [Gammaproteobacteria bacterium]
MRWGLAEKYLTRITGWRPTGDGQGSKTDWWGYFPVAWVSAVGISITLAASVQSYRWEKRQVEIAFREAAQERILVVQQEITHALNIVQDIASFFDASAIVGRRDFRKFVGPALKRYPGIRSLQWVPVVLAADRSAFIDQARRSFPPFRIIETTPSGEPVESGERPVHYPVLYIQPYSSNKQSLGLDLGLDPIISPLLNEAQSTKEPAASQGISFDSETGEKQGVVVAIPVFFENEEDNDAINQPPLEIRGFALGTFYVENIVERAVRNLRSAGIDIHFYQIDAAGGQKLLYTHLSRLRRGKPLDTESPSLSYGELLSAGNRQWQVICNPAPGKFETEITNSWIILAGGIAFTALLSIYVATLIGWARQVRQEVDVRTSQLWETVQDLNREVAERKSAEQELQSLNETLEQHIASRTAEADRRAQYLEQFAYVTSHDLKAPLRAVSNLAGWIEEDLNEKLDHASKEQLALLRDRVRRMHNLIEGLLEYSRVGRTSEPENEVDTGELIKEIIDSLSPPKGFRIKVQEDMPTLYVDRLQLGQVFSNLISNSLRHHGGEKGKIRITSEDLGEFCKFSVCDNGQGIDPKYHDKVFMMFQTLNSGDVENSTGIGLALVKKIVEEHGGTIRLESDVGKGTCFYFTWPSRRPAA